MAEPNLDELNTGTRKEIMPSVADNFFKSGPVIRYMRENRMKVFPGGTLIQENFLFRPMKGDFYQKGAQFDVTKRQTKTGMQFTIKKAYVNVTEYLEDVEIELRAEHAVFDQVRVDMANAALTLSAILEIAAMKHGQDLSGSGGANRVAAFNGFEEALNNGVAASYTGLTFAGYGGQARADVNRALTPPVGAIAANVGGPVNNHVLEMSYQSCVIGEEHPKLGITTSRCVGYINENYAPLQRLVDTVDPVIGWPGLKFKQATIVESQYMPGVDGINDADIGDYSSPQGTGPTGETLLWMNPGGEGDDAYVRLHIAASEKFQFGFTGFKVGRDDTMVAGQVLFGGNLIIRTPRLMRLLHGITAA